MFQNAFAILVVYDGIYQLIEVKSLILDSPKGHYTRRKGPVLFNGIYIYIYTYISSRKMQIQMQASQF
jgi:hypothetical protein